MQQFFTETLNGNLIKNILHSNYLSNIDYVDDDGYIIEGFDYIYNHNIIECTKSGYINNQAEYFVISPYFEDQSYPNINYTFFSKYRYYDYDTHRELGNYLRGLKYLKNLDLFSLYNCYSSKLISEISLSCDCTENSNEYQIDIINQKNKKYNNIVIPIKFNQKYTIAIEGLNKYLISPIIYSTSGRIIFEKTSDDVFYYDDFEQIKNCRQRINYSSFNSPFIFYLPLQMKDGDILYNEKVKKLYSLQDNLYLLIQLPKGNKSSIVVLEGDYTDTSNNIYDLGNIKNISKKQLNKLTLSPNISLLKYNNGKTYAFADRLMEYLLNSPTTQLDDFSGNIQRVQNNLFLTDSHNSDYGVWSDNIQGFAYDRFRNYYIRISNSDQKNLKYLKLVEQPYDWSDWFPKNKYYEKSDSGEDILLSSLPTISYTLLTDDNSPNDWKINNFPLNKYSQKIGDTYIILNSYVEYYPNIYYLGVFPQNKYYYFNEDGIKIYIDSEPEDWRFPKDKYYEHILIPLIRYEEYEPNHYYEYKDGTYDLLIDSDAPTDWTYKGDFPQNKYYQYSFVPINNPPQFLTNKYYEPIVLDDYEEYEPNKYYTYTPSGYVIIDSEDAPDDWVQDFVQDKYYIKNSDDTYTAINTYVEYELGKYYVKNVYQVVLTDGENPPDDWINDFPQNKYYKKIQGQYVPSDTYIPINSYVPYLPNGFYENIDDQFVLLDSDISPNDWVNNFPQNKYYEYTNGEYQLLTAYQDFEQYKFYIEGEGQYELLNIPNNPNDWVHRFPRDKYYKDFDSLVEITKWKQYQPNKYYERNGQEYSLLTTIVNPNKWGDYYQIDVQYKNSKNYNNIIHEDILGYVDKDVEYFISNLSKESIQSIFYIYLQDSKYDILHENRFVWKSEQEDSDYYLLMEELVNNIVLKLIKLKLAKVTYDEYNYSSVESKIHDILINIIQETYSPNWTKQQKDVFKSWRVYN